MFTQKSLTKFFTTSVSKHFCPIPFFYQTAEIVDFFKHTIFTRFRNQTLAEVGTKSSKKKILNRNTLSDLTLVFLDC